MTRPGLTAGALGPSIVSLNTNILLLLLLLLLYYCSTYYCRPFYDSLQTLRCVF